jgi:hypothetical protein
MLSARCPKRVDRALTYVRTDPSSAVTSVTSVRYAALL